MNSLLFNFLRNPSGYEFIDVIVGLLSSLAVIFITMPVHEFAHAYAATRLGDPTPKYSGRLSINPINHIDYIGALCIILFGFGWAKPVGVNPRNFRDVKRGMAITALAGPLSNIVMAFIITFAAYSIYSVYYHIAHLTFIYLIADFLYYIAYINVSLAVFNLIPIPPLDGSRVLNYFLPYKAQGFMDMLENYSSYIILGLLLLSNRTDFLSDILSVPMEAIIWLFDKITFFLGNAYYYPLSFFLN